MKNESKKIFIECDCGTHILSVQSEIELRGEDRFVQDVYIALFSYGEHVPKDRFWGRIKYCWNYLLKGTIYRDQVILSPSEALKLSDFLQENVIKIDE